MFLFGRKQRAGDWQLFKLVGEGYLGRNCGTYAYLIMILLIDVISKSWEIVQQTK